MRIGPVDVVPACTSSALGMFGATWPWYSRLNPRFTKSGEPSGSLGASFGTSALDAAPMLSVDEAFFDGWQPISWCSLAGQQQQA